MTLRLALLTLSVFTSLQAEDAVISPFAESTLAPHGQGNVYAPDIVRFQGKLFMFFGGQGKDGHDRIHLATSGDGQKWDQHGVVLAPEGVNHVNDPSVVVVGDTLHMFYTLAVSGITDSIGLATSEEGRKWEDLGVVFSAADAPAWDSLLVGRPSVIHEDGKFLMWYDGRMDLPLGAPDAIAPKSDSSRRYVGLATSADGSNWERRADPVFGEDAGGVHVLRRKEGFVMVIESRDGTKWASSSNGILWTGRGLLHPKGEDKSAAYGNVTPFLNMEGDTARLYYGAAAAATWDHNSIRSSLVEIPAQEH